MKFRLRVRTLEIYLNFIRFSHSSGKLEKMINRRIDFKNILNDSEHNRKYSLKKLTVNLGVRLSKKDISEFNSDDEVEPLCASMEKMSSRSIVDAAVDTPVQHKDSISDCPDLLQTENYAQQMKTPNEPTTANCGDQRGISFRKSLIIDSGLTPHEDHNAANSKNDNEAITNGRPKAKTSLTFGESTISTKSFYGNNVSTEPTDRKPISALSVMSFAELLKKIKPKSKANSARPKVAHTRPKGPSLWKHSGDFKRYRQKARLIVKQKKRADKVKKTSEQTNKENDENAKNVNNNVPDQNKRLQKILQERSNILNASREIDWNVTGDGKRIKNSRPMESSDEDDDDDENENKNRDELQDENVDSNNGAENVSGRKFFKSKGNNAAKRYRIMSNLNATLKRGSDLKLEVSSKRRKRNQAKRNVNSCF